MKRFIGLSLSFCVRDILRGVIDWHEISAIVSSTRFESLQEALAYYYISYWSEYADEDTCRTLLLNIWPIVFQPRLVRESACHSVGHGFWLDTYTGILTKHPERDFASVENPQ